jgi:hypothetical protein
MMPLCVLAALSRREKLNPELLELLSGNAQKKATKQAVGFKVTASACGG